MDRLLTNTLNIVFFYNINAVFVMHWTFRMDTYTHFNLINYIRMVMDALVATFRDSCERFPQHQSVRFSAL